MSRLSWNSPSFPGISVFRFTNAKTALQPRALISTALTIVKSSNSVVVLNLLLLIPSRLNVTYAAEMLHLRISLKTLFDIFCLFTSRTPTEDKITLISFHFKFSLGVKRKKFTMYYLVVNILCERYRMGHRLLVHMIWRTKESNWPWFYWKWADRKETLTVTLLFHVTRWYVVSPHSTSVYCTSTWTNHRKFNG